MLGERKDSLTNVITFTSHNLNYRTLNSLNERNEMIVHLEKYNIPICSIQEHRFFHKANDPDIIAKPLGRYTLFTALAWKATNNATIGGVGIIIRTDLLPILSSVRKISDRIVIADLEVTLVLV